MDEIPSSGVQILPRNLDILLLELGVGGYARTNVSAIPRTRLARHLLLRLDIIEIQTDMVTLRIFTNEKISLVSNADETHKNLLGHIDPPNTSTTPEIKSPWGFSVMEWCTVEVVFARD